MGKIKYYTRNLKKANGRFNKTKKNKRIYSGGKTAVKTAVKADDKPAVKPERTGIMDYMGNQFEDLASESTSYLTNKTARLFGFKPINAAEAKADQKEIDKASKSVSDMTSDISDSVNDSSASMINDMNSVLEAPVVNEAV